MGRGRNKAKRAQKRKQARRARAAARPAPPSLTAATADKYDLYQRAVQSPEDDIPFLVETCRSLRSEPARHLREDFCGTAALAAAWIAHDPAFSAEGYDIDPAPIEWGWKHNFEPLGEAKERMAFHVADVREPSQRPPELRLAMNFSYCCFKSRRELLEYFRAVHEDLAPEGVFALDIHGGPECQEEMEEERKIGRGVTYVWEQAEFWPATAETRCSISFEFKDGSELRRVFEYDWRLWTLPELKDALEEVGFRQVQSYWEGDDESGEGGDGDFKASERGDNCLSWIAYLVARK